MSEYRTIFVDGTAIPTTMAGALAIEKLQGQLRDARNEIDGLSGQLAALQSIRDEAPGTPADARQAARDAKVASERRMTDAWKNQSHAA